MNVVSDLELNQKYLNSGDADEAVENVVEDCGVGGCEDVLQVKTSRSEDSVTLFNGSSKHRHL